MSLERALLLFIAGLLVVRFNRGGCLLVAIVVGWTCVELDSIASSSP